MTKGIYPETMKVISGLMAVLDNQAIIEEIEDAGLAIEGIQLTDADGERYVGNLEFSEGHPVFYPAD